MSQVMSQPQARRDCRHPELMAESEWGLEGLSNGD